MNKKVWGIIIMILLILSILSITINNILYGGYEYKNEIIQSGEYRNFVMGGNKGDEIHIIIKSNKPVNCYIQKGQTEGGLYLIGGKIENKSDDFFKNSELTKENQSEYDFKWTIPANKFFLIVVYNPNNENATFSIKYTDPTSERMGWVCLFMIVVVVVIIIFAYRRYKKKIQYPPPQQQSPPPIQQDKT
jgi:hypothetical protein